MATKYEEMGRDDTGRREAGINIWPIRFGPSFASSYMGHIRIEPLLALLLNETILQEPAFSVSRSTCP